MQIEIYLIQKTQGFAAHFPIKTITRSKLKYKSDSLLISAFYRIISMEIRSSAYQIILLIRVEKIMSGTPRKA